MAPSACLSAALEALERGWSVVPLCPADHSGVSGQHEQSCRRPGKEPLFDATAYHGRRPQERELRLLWGRCPGAGLGILLGPISGLVGLFVSGSAGEVQLGCQSGGSVPPTLEIATPGDGRCLLFAMPPEARLSAPPCAEQDGFLILGPGQHTVLPPTPGYRWRPGHGPTERAAAPSPTWLREALGETGLLRPKARDYPLAVVCSARELLAQPHEELRWAVPHLIPEGATLLAGRPKTGKSWLSLGLALAIASGSSVLGGPVVEQGDVLYLALEDGPRRLRRRLQHLLESLNLPPPAELHLATHWPRLSEGALPRLDSWLTGHPRTRLVVLDTLARVRDRRSQGGAYGEDYHTLAALKDLGDGHGCAIVVVHHTRKGEAADPVELITGTLGLAGAADCALVLRHPRHSEEGQLFVTGRDVEEREWYLRWDALRCVWERQDPTTIGATREQREILEAMRLRGNPITPTQLAHQLGKSKDAVKQLLRRMADQYRLIRHGELRGTYELQAESQGLLGRPIS